MIFRKKQYNRILFAFIVMCSVLYFYFLERNEKAKQTYTWTSMVIYEDLYELYVADTEEERIQGLSGKENLLPNTGMFFKFDALEQHGIWMKDMNFPIDILWLTRGCEVAAFKSADPASYPEVFTPKNLSLYVVELPLNSIAEKVQIGDKLECPKI